jgi:hypothetical protein
MEQLYTLTLQTSQADITFEYLTIDDVEAYIESIQEGVEWISHYPEETRGLAVRCSEIQAYWWDPEAPEEPQEPLEYLEAMNLQRAVRYIFWRADGGSKVEETSGSFCSSSKLALEDIETFRWLLEEAQSFDPPVLDAEHLEACLAELDRLEVQLSHQRSQSPEEPPVDLRELCCTDPF